MRTDSKINGHPVRLEADARDAVRLDAEFAALIPPLSGGELAKLQESILAEGCRDALLVWRGHDILLDGYNRIDICRRHRLPFRIEYREFSDREAARHFVITTQLGRRNLSAEGASYLRGMRYLAEKLPHGGGRRAPLTDQRDRLNTAARLAREFSVSEATLRRDGRFTRAVQAIAGNCGADVKKPMLARDGGLRRGAVLRIVKLSPESQRDAIAQWLKTGRLPRRRPSENKAFTVPADPRVFAAQLARKFGADRSRDTSEPLAVFFSATQRRVNRRGQQPASRGHHVSLASLDYVRFTEQMPALLGAAMIAEVSYRSHSFLLECGAFLATWLVLDALIQAAVFLGHGVGLATKENG